MSRPDRCETCSHEEQGECRYGPPTVFQNQQMHVTESAFPTVLPDWWCSKWKERAVVEPREAALDVENFTLTLQDGTVLHLSTGVDEDAEECEVDDPRCCCWIFELGPEQWTPVPLGEDRPTRRTKN